MTVFSEMFFDLYDHPDLSISDLFPYIGEKTSKRHVDAFKSDARPV